MALLLASCGDGSKPSAEQNKQLDHASQMLDQADNALADIDDNLLAEPAGNSARPAD